MTVVVLIYTVYTVKDMGHEESKFKHLQIDRPFSHSNEQGGQKYRKHENV